MGTDPFGSFIEEDELDAMGRIADDDHPQYLLGSTGMETTRLPRVIDGRLVNRRLFSG